MLRGRDKLALQPVQPSPFFVCVPHEGYKLDEDIDPVRVEEDWSDLNYAIRVMAGMMDQTDSREVAEGMLQTLAVFGATQSIRSIALSSLTNKLTE